ncbi:glycosyltransferase family 2 protein [Thalassotalea mangrovi]|uniref:Glycosyltransferase family 2 protein n=1 Tax=Thalassotalea mangrovi TaxID=2572245 RepID=A0A4U1B4K6_9GAMM|nr:glycosyltransferase family 2 protein [Thalassotalea mangrovi]TKB45174.1 glycosyltransferase family 2 protein [Thalassotalea mangrovi]
MHPLLNQLLRPYRMVKHGGQIALYLLKSSYYSRQLSVFQDNTQLINRGDIILFATLRNEAHRMEYFLDYYRRLGVDHFILVDNDSNDGFRFWVKEHQDVTVFFTRESYKASNFGMHWLNYLLRKFGSGHWCLTCDPDEFLVYPKQEEMDLKQLCQYLQQTHRPSFYTNMVDMYGKGALKECLYQPGSDPLQSHPYFDRSGYFYRENKAYSSLWAQGGVRLRTLFKDTPEHGPALNKTPLINWRWYYAYISSMHMAIPRKLNKGYQQGLTGALLHFKFIAEFEQKIVEEMERKEHYGDSIEYKKYQQFLKDSMHFEPRLSVKYQGWQQLQQLGLIVNQELI